jgi:hypothetical protein
MSAKSDDAIKNCAVINSDIFKPFMGHLCPGFLAGLIMPPTMLEKSVSMHIYHTELT